MLLVAQSLCSSDVLVRRARYEVGHSRDQPHVSMDSNRKGARAAEKNDFEE